MLNIDFSHYIGEDAFCSDATIEDTLAATREILDTHAFDGETQNPYLIKGILLIQLYHNLISLKALCDKLNERR